MDEIMRFFVAIHFIGLLFIFHPSSFHLEYDSSDAHVSVR